MGKAACLWINQYIFPQNLHEKKRRKTRFFGRSTNMAAVRQLQRDGKAYPRSQGTCSRREPWTQGWEKPAWERGTSAANQQSLTLVYLNCLFSLGVLLIFMRLVKAVK